VRNHVALEVVTAPVEDVRRDRRNSARAQRSTGKLEQDDPDAAQGGIAPSHHGIVRFPDLICPEPQRGKTGGLKSQFVLLYCECSL
jgi:hypothetical protein